jgi:hypothetical protein
MQTTATGLLHRNNQSANPETAFSNHSPTTQQFVCRGFDPV